MKADTSPTMAMALVVATLVLAPVVASATPAPTEPTITVTNDPFPDDLVIEGATFKLEGANWPPNTLVQLEVCGSEARSGSSDCAIGTAQIVASDDAGWFQARLGVVVPPTPCPCVVRATSQSSSAVATTPVEIPNAPTQQGGDGTVIAPALRRLEVTKAKLTGSDDWRTWLGARPNRTLVFEITNTGSVRITGATVALGAGPSDKPTGFVQPVKIEPLDVGESRTYTVPIRFESLAWGRQVVKGTILGTSATSTFALATSSHPWLLVIIPAVIVLQVALLLIRNALRRRLQRNEPVATDTVAVKRPAVGDCLICVIEAMQDPEESGAAPGTVLARRTAVVRGLAGIQAFLRQPIDVPMVDANGVAGASVPGVVDVITVLADARATVRDAHAACEELCRWLETESGLGSSTAAGNAGLRRWPSTMPDGADGAGDFGMVPMTVFVRVNHDRIAA